MTDDDDALSRRAAGKERRRLALSRGSVLPEAAALRLFRVPELRRALRRPAEAAHLIPARDPHRPGENIPEPPVLLIPVGSRPVGAVQPLEGVLPPRLSGRLLPRFELHRGSSASARKCRAMPTTCGPEARVPFTRALHFQMSEEAAFLLLRHLMFRRGIRKQYLPDMAALQVQLYQLTRLLYDTLPKLYAHLDRNEVAPTLYAAPWMLTLFASQFPLGFVTRVFGE